MHDFFKFIFYFIGVAAIIWEMYVLSHPRKTHAFIKNMNKREKGANGKKEFTGTETAYSFLMMGYIIWCIVGLFSSQYVAFIFLMLLSYIVLSINPFFRWINSLISILTLVFIIMNAYHLHIDSLELLKQFVMYIINHQMYVKV